MGNSLRDELLKAGLVSEEQAREAARPKPKKAQKRQRGRKGGKARPRRQSAGRADTPTAAEASEPATATRHVLRENQRRTARFVRDATLGGGSVAENAKKALRKKIDALIERERRNQEGAELAYHFVKGKRIKRVYVTEAQRDALTDGALVIAALEGNHHIMTRAAAEALQALASQTVICTGADEGAGADDAGEHPVPDDITW